MPKKPQRFTVKFTITSEEMRVSVDLHESALASLAIIEGLGDCTATESLNYAAEVLTTLFNIEQKTGLWLKYSTDTPLTPYSVQKIPCAPGFDEEDEGYEEEEGEAGTVITMTEEYELYRRCIFNFGPVFLLGLAYTSLKAEGNPSIRDCLHHALTVTEAVVSAQAIGGSVLTLDEHHTKPGNPKYVQIPLPFPRKR